MKNIFYILICILLVNSFSSFGQNKVGDDLVVSDSLVKNKSKMNPLSPAKAAFYSAIFPGMGQVYNKKYWKVPLVYGALGTSIYFLLSNQKKYNQYRDAYKRRLEGFTDDDYRYLDDTRLIAGQKFYQTNRDLSALVTLLFYFLNIVDANVDAHLMQFNVNDKLSFKPNLYRDDLTARDNLGFKLSYNFK
ncbi:MAG: hypothetical protein H7239_07545 [Flavobacterium sp.]|nr:hypothetical protein [Flavobacterium sp.]